MSIYYNIIPSRPEAHVLTVQLRATLTHEGCQEFYLPTWIPGSYMIRDFAKNIIRVYAECNGKSWPIEKMDKTTWRVSGCVGEITLTYDVYAWDLSVRAAHCDQTHAYFNGSCVFMAVRGQEDLACHVMIEKPQGNLFENWRVITALSPVNASRYTFGEYRANNYDELIDHPVEMGTFELLTFTAAGVQHDIAITGMVTVDGQRLCRDLKKICEAQINFFGIPAPMDYYCFLVMAVGEGYGGLEHRASTSLLCSRDDLPKPNDSRTTEAYRGFLGLCSHEYFHTWNVKRIKPAVFMPYDLSREVHTPLLWAFEGITSYYDELFLYRAGIVDKHSYLEMLGETLTRVLRSLGRFKQTVSQSSFDAWTKLYKADENAPNAIVSYYVKGAYVALALDLTLRDLSRNTISLDDVMRHLWQEYGLKNKGVEDDSIEIICEKLLGQSLHQFFEQALHSTTDIALEELLAKAGVKLTVRPAESLVDKGGKKSTQSIALLQQRAEMGVRVSAHVDGVLLQTVFDGSAAQQAGLSAHDVLIAINGLKVSMHNFEKRLQQYSVGQAVIVHAFRRDELREYVVTLQAPRCDTCELAIDTESPKITWL